MRIASLPLNEDLRLQDLYAHEILDTESEKEFDDLLRLVTRVTGCSMAAVAFIDESRQWLKAKSGFDITESPRETAFCSHTILQTGLMVVEDATEDERFFDNPYVAGNPKIRFYAGAPIRSGSGYALGTVCVVDTQPRTLTPDEEDVLRIVSEQISRLLELRLKNKVLKRRATEMVQTEKKLLRKTLRKQEAERLSISTELHEDIAQSLAATKMYLEMADMNTGKTPELVAKSRDCVTKVLQQVRSLSKTIAPSTLKELDLEDLLLDLRSRFQQQSGVAVTLNYWCTIAPPADVSLALYRMVEEQLENVRRHAQASQVWIQLQVSQTVHLSVRDNGIGLNTSTLKKGTGLNNILAQVEQLNGVLDIAGGPRTGCTLTVTFPLPAPVALAAARA